MRSDSNTYQKVAEHCSSFDPKKDSDTFKSLYSDSENSEISCTNCKHFDKDAFCKLDLYDQIVVNHKFQ